MRNNNNGEGIKGGKIKEKRPVHNQKGRKLKGDEAQVLQGKWMAC